jgi:SAM-dependent methyltransferase
MVMLSDKLRSCLMCPVCEGTELELVVDEVEDDVLVDASLGCSDCGRWYMVRDDIPRMMPPEVASNLAASNEAWEDWGAAMHRFLRWRESAWADPEAAAERRRSAREMHESFIEFCELPDGEIDLLDVGSGTGHLADLLPESICYVGIDPLPAGASPGGGLPSEIPRPQRPISLVQGVGESLPFAPACFDAGLIVGTLDHARDPEQMLAEAARALRPGALMCVLQGLSSGRGGDSGGLLRSIMRALRGEQGPGALQTHLHTFASAEDVAGLVGGQFEVTATAGKDRRAFVRAIRPGDEA